MIKTNVVQVTKVPSTSDEIERVHQSIRDRAYQKFIERGAYHGNAIEDWLSAEQELFLVPTVEFTEQDDLRVAELNVAGSEQEQIHIVTDGSRLIVRTDRKTVDEHTSASRAAQLFVTIDHFSGFDPETLRVELRGRMLRILAPWAAEKRPAALEKTA
jgi:HSP20 family molecular chaperone IbpA